MRLFGSMQRFRSETCILLSRFRARFFDLQARYRCVTKAAEVLVATVIECLFRWGASPFRGLSAKTEKSAS